MSLRRVQIRVRATLSGGNLAKDIELDCLGYTTTFALGAIPSIQLYTAYGRKAETMALADLHKQASELTNSMALKVEAIVDRSYSKFWPGDNLILTVFEGLTSQIGVTAQFGQTAYQITGTGWLDNLAFSSAMSGATTPATPADFYQQVRIQGATGVGDDAYAAALITASKNGIAGVGDDLWGKIIKPAFEFLAGTDRLTYWAENETPPLGAKNDAALSALNKMDRTSQFVVKLPIPFPMVSYAVLKAVGRVIFSGEGGGSLWDKLRRLSSVFFFGLVPTIRSAYVAPLITMLLGEPYKEIPDSEIQSLNLTGSMLRPIRSMNLYGPRLDYTGYNVSTANPDRAKKVATYDLAKEYANPETSLLQGLNLYERMPSWLANIPLHSASPRKTAHIGDGTVNIRTAFNTTAAAPQPRPEEEKDAGLTAAENYAKALFYARLFSRRRAIVSGPLRYDISPGSFLRIVQPASSETVAYFGKKIYGLVRQVTCTVNAQTSQATTTFNLSHIRRHDEYANGMGVQVHPLFGTRWEGIELWN